VGANFLAKHNFFNGDGFIGKALTANALVEIK
jgi:hypothetical protein